MTDHVEHYDNALDGNYCNSLIDKFESDSGKEPGQTGTGVDSTRKDSTDLVLNTTPGWESELSPISNNLVMHFARYARKYTYLLFGNIGQVVTDPATNESITLTAENISTVSDRLIVELLNSSFRFGGFMLQKYKQGTGGYHAWHSEIAPNHPQYETLHRVLFVIYYLNDVELGGETAFFYQDKLVRPKTGRLVLSPCSFTHTHKGNVPQSGDKYILTSWIMYKRFEQMKGDGTKQAG